MAEKKYIDFLNKLIDDTKERKIEWKYLDKNKTLYEGMNWTKVSSVLGLFSGEKEKTYADFNVEDSFYTIVNETYIVIYVYGTQPATLYVIPSTFKKVVILSPDLYGEFITRLLNLVQSQFPSGDAFIDSFLKSEDPTE